MLALVSRLFTLFETWEWRPRNTNPARGIERACEEPRDRICSPAELAAFALALKDVEVRRPAPMAAIRLAAFTDLRIGEILGIRWEHLALQSGRLTLPATKTGRRAHYLPAIALAILNALPRASTIGPLQLQRCGSHVLDGTQGLWRGRRRCRSGACATARSEAYSDDACCDGRGRNARASGPAWVQDDRDVGPICSRRR